MRELFDAIEVKLRTAHLPLWVYKARDRMRYSRRVLFARNTYPVADRAGSLSCRPLLVLSSGRSGTTLLRSMLVAGQQLAMPPESQIIRTAVRRYLALQHIGWEDISQLIIGLFESSTNFDLWDVDLQPVYATVSDIPSQERSLARIIDEVYRHYAAEKFPHAHVWGDKSPINTLHLPFIYAAFPQARYLHVVRDGRDAIASMVERGRAVEAATRRWEISIRQARALEPRLNEDQYLEVRYEDLVSRPEDTLKRICSFAGIRFSPSMLDFWRLPTTVEHKHYDHHRNLGRPVFTDSIGRWVNRLSDSEQEYVYSRISGLLEHLGYLGG